MTTTTTTAITPAPFNLATTITTITKAAKARAKSDTLFTDAFKAIVMNFWATGGNHKAAADCLQAIEGLVNTGDFRIISSFVSKFVGISIRKEDGSVVRIETKDGRKVMAYQKSKEKQAKIIEDNGYMAFEEMADDIEVILDTHIALRNGSIFGREEKPKASKTDAEKLDAAVKGSATSLKKAHKAGVTANDIVEGAVAGGYTMSDLLAQFSFDDLEMEMERRRVALDAAA